MTTLDPVPRPGRPRNFVTMWLTWSQLRVVHREMVVDMEVKRKRYPNHVTSELAMKPAGHRRLFRRSYRIHRVPITISTYCMVLINKKLCHGQAWERRGVEVVMGYDFSGLFTIHIGFYIFLT